MGAFEDRRWVTIPLSSTSSIDFNDVLETSIDLATELMENAPLALRASKESISNGNLLPLKEALNVEKSAYGKTLESADRIEALRAFSHKKKPKWSGK